MNPYEPLIKTAKGDFRRQLNEAWARRKIVVPRDYQVEATNNTLNAFDRGKSALLVLSTGTGKTEVMLNIIQNEIERGKMGRVLYMAHRQELIYQPLTRIVRGWELPCPGIVQDKYHMVDAPIVVSSVQTLSARRHRRLKEILKHGPITHIITDEAHRSTAKTYMQIYAILKHVNPSLKILGATASPFRADEEELSQVYDEVTYRLGTIKAIEMGALCHFKGKTPRLNFSLRDVKRTAEGWDEGRITQLMATINAEEIVVEKWKEEAQEEGRPTIAFAASIEQAKRLAEAFQRQGISAAWAGGETPSAIRQNILRDYNNGELQVICNYGIWVEGMDAPQTECVIMCRPTTSPIVYMQAIGRGLRTHPGKKNCLILQFVPQEAPIDLMLIGDLLGKPKKEQLLEAKAAKAGKLLDDLPPQGKKEKLIEVLEDETSSLNFFAEALQAERDTGKVGIEGDADSVVMTTLNLLAKGRHNKMAWVTERMTRVSTLSVAPGMSLAITPVVKERKERADAIRLKGEWSCKWDEEYANIANYTLYCLDTRHKSQRGALKNQKPFFCVFRSEDLERVLVVAYELATVHGQKWLYMKNGTKKFKLDPTDKQIEFAGRLGVEYKPGMTRGQISQAIDHQIMLSRLKQEGILK